MSSTHKLVEGILDLLSKKMESVRWCFNFGNWNPLRNEWLLAGQCIQPEERERISRFVFTKDMKAAMSGRLLLRKLLHEKVGLPYELINLARTDKGKPYLLNSVSSKFDSLSFNVSHQGQYSVLAAEPCDNVGVDVMKIEYVGGKTVPEFFRLMQRQFTQLEWSNILSTSTEREQLAQFYRHWCLKESYVKALGIGIGFELQRLSFKINTPFLQENKITYDTELLLDGKNVSADWLFEESLLDDHHCVAVALNKNFISSDPNNNKFTLLHFEQLMEKAVPWQTVMEDFWNNFCHKEEKPSSR